MIRLNSTYLKFVNNNIDRIVQTTPFVSPTSSLMLISLSFLKIQTQLIINAKFPKTK
jgi:hypothetical protein